MATQRQIAVSPACIHGKWERVESAGGHYLGDLCTACGAAFGYGACDNCGKDKRLLVSAEGGWRYCHESCKKLADADRLRFSGPRWKWMPPRGKR